MADRNLHYLDVPRAEPAKSAVEVRIANFREIYARYEPEQAEQPGRGAASPVAIPFANGSARSTTTFPIG
jgi:hypothetical protein